MSPQGRGSNRRGKKQWGPLPPEVVKHQLRRTNPNADFLDVAFFNYYRRGGDHKVHSKKPIRQDPAPKGGQS